MTKEEAREILIQYNAYRRGGANSPMPNPTEAGQAIDVAIQALSDKSVTEPSEGGKDEKAAKNKVFYSALKHTSDLPINNMKLFKELAFEMMESFSTLRTAQLQSELDRLNDSLTEAIRQVAEKDKDKAYLSDAIRLLQSELSAANESLTVMVRKNAELLESVRPDVVVPSEKEVKSDLIYHSYLDGKNKGWNECLSELRRLNPTMTFTELNHEK